MRFWLILLLITGLCFEARAFDVSEDCPEKPIEERSSVALASTWFEKGQEGVRKKEYNKAMNAFLCSLRMVEHPSTMFNAGNAAFLAGKYDVANEMAQMILSREVDEATQKDAEKLLADSQHAMEGPETGSEAIQQDQPSAMSHSREAGFHFDKRDTLSVEEGLKESEPSLITRFPLRFWGWTSLGVGGVLLIGGGITGSLALAKNVEVKNACQGRVCYEADYHLVDTRNNLATVSTVLIVSAGVIAAAGVVLTILGVKKESKKQDVAWGFGPDGIRVQGAF